MRCPVGALYVEGPVAVGRSVKACGFSSDWWRCPSPHCPITRPHFADVEPEDVKAEVERIFQQLRSERNQVCRAVRWWWHDPGGGSACAHAAVCGRTALRPCLPCGWVLPAGGWSPLTVPIGPGLGSGDVPQSGAPCDAIKRPELENRSRLTATAFPASTRHGYTTTARHEERRWGGGGGAPAAVPRTMGLGVVPRGSRAHQPGESSVLPPQEQDGSRRTPENALPSRPSGCQRRRTATPRSDLPPGPGHRPSDSPGSTRVSVPESASAEGMGLPGASPPT